jgi:uncharacterized protein YcbX
MLTIAGLWIYPVKSLGGVALDRVEITPHGSLRGDREWLVVDAEDRMLWQGDLPRMTLLRVGLTSEALSLARPDGAALSLDPNHDGAGRVVTQYGNSFNGTDAGDAAAQFLSDWLGRPVRLVRIGAEAHCWPKVNPVHMLSDLSLDALNARLVEAGHAPVTLARFRPNVLLAGGSTAFEEESRPLLDFGPATIRLREPATRCELPQISLTDASIGRQPLPTIARMSRERSTARKGSFGVYCQAQGNHLAIGMTLQG